MEKICTVCNKTYQAGNNKSKYCSGACKQKGFRDARKTIRSPRNHYFGVDRKDYVIIISPEGTDISKLLNLRTGTRDVIKQIQRFRKEKRSRFTVKRVKVK